MVHDNHGGLKSRWAPLAYGVQYRTCMYKYLKACVVLVTLPYLTAPGIMVIHHPALE